MHADLTNEEISEAYNAVRRFVENEFTPGLRRDYAIDRATTTFMNALSKFRPMKGKPNSFTGYALKCVARSFTKVHGRKIPAISSSGIEQASRDHRRSLNPGRYSFEDFQYLAPSVQKVMFLRLVIGFCDIDVGLLTGRSRQDVQKQVIEGLRIIGP